MIKTKLPFLLVLFNFFFFRAQSVVVSCGDDFSVDGKHLSWTLGELVTETLNGSSYVLTQGFQQSYSNSLGIAELLSDALITIYPNPSPSNLTVNLPDVDEHVSISLYDSRSRLILSEKYAAGFSKNAITIKLDDLSAGVYYVNIIISGKEHMKQIIKL